MENLLTKTYVFILIAGIGGLVKYLKGANFSFQGLLIRVLSSAFTGWIIGLMSLHFQLSIEMSCALCGICGYLGADTTISLLEKFIKKKIE